MQEKYYGLYRLTNKKTGQSFESRGLRNVLSLAGLSPKTPSAQLNKSKTWVLEELEKSATRSVEEHQVYRRELYKRSQERYKKYADDWNKRDPKRLIRRSYRIKNWKNKDGSPFTIEQFDEIRIQPCCNCGSSENIVVDHDHETGIVRGALCRCCNLILGHAKDNVGVLLGLVEYLRNHNEQS